MSGIEGAIWLFAWERFERLAQEIAAALEEHPASGVYGDDAEDEDGYPLETLWDEFRHEVGFGPHDDVIEYAWNGTVRPFIEAAISAISQPERRLLFLATKEGLTFDADTEELPPAAAVDELVEEVNLELRNLAGKSRQQRSGSTSITRESVSVVPQGRITPRFKRGLLPWAPPNGNPVITAVLAPVGPLNEMAYLDLMRDRVAEMIKAAGEDAEEQIRAALPLDHDFLDFQPPASWAQGLMEAGEMVEFGLADALPAKAFPAEVKGPNPWAREGLSARLETWLALVVPREPGD